MARCKGTCDSSIETLNGIAEMARRSVRDAKTLESLLIEAGEFNPGLLVNSLVKSRTLDISEMMTAVTYKAEEAVYDKPLTPAEEAKYEHAKLACDKAYRAELARKNSIVVPIIPIRPTVAPLHDNNVADDWRFDGDDGIDLDETILKPCMNGKHD